MSMFGEMHLHNFEPNIYHINPIVSLFIIKQNLQATLLHEMCINNSLNLLATESARQSDPLKILEQSDVDLSSSISTSNCSNICNKSPKKRIKNPKNDTKNIPKNFGKAIISFVLQKEELVRKLLKNENIEYFRFVEALTKKKQKINSIADLRNLWLESGFEYSKQMRIISLYFLKKGSLQYIFGSRISNYEGHVKYRKRLMEAIRNPEDFTFIKN